MNMKLRNIPFSPPDMSDAEIEMVAEALRSGWITTGPKTKEFEQLIAICCGTFIFSSSLYERGLTIKAPSFCNGVKNPITQS